MTIIQDLANHPFYEYNVGLTYHHYYEYWARSSVEELPLLCNEAGQFENYVKKNENIFYKLFNIETKRAYRVCHSPLFFTQ